MRRLYPHCPSLRHPLCCRRPSLEDLLHLPPRRPPKLDSCKLPPPLSENPAALSLSPSLPPLPPTLPACLPLSLSLCIYFVLSLCVLVQNHLSCPPLQLSLSLFLSAGSLPTNIRNGSLSHSVPRQDPPPCNLQKFLRCPNR